MSLQFILGHSGSGKSTYLYSEIINRAISEPDKQILFIVPEQFTLHTQKELVRLHPRHSVMNIEVLSFERLAYRVFDELGTDTLNVLEDTGKNLVLRRLVEENKDSLTTLGGNASRLGVISEIKSLISEMTQYNITPEILEEMIEDRNVSEAFRIKAKDMLVLYEAFIQYIDGKYITSEEILELLNEVMEDSYFIKDAVIVFDGYTGFTPIQNNLLKNMFSLAEKVYVSVTIPGEEIIFTDVKEHDLFFMSKKMIQSTSDIARSEKVTIEPPVILPLNNPIRFEKDGVLLHLEKNLCRGSYTKIDINSDMKDSIEIHELMAPRDELYFVASDIRKIVRETDARFYDFAICCANMEDYQNYIEGIFAKYDVPVFVDTKSEIVFHPLFEYIQSGFEIIFTNYSYEAVMHFLKAGFMEDSLEAIDLFENYVLATGIRGRRAYENEFSYCPKNYEESDLEIVNAVREHFLQAIEEIRYLSPQKHQTVREYTYRLYQFLAKNNIQEKLDIKSTEYEEKGDLVKSRQYSQVYRLLIDLMDKMVSLLGENSMNLREYVDVLNAGLESISIGVIPSTYDCVLFGDMERTRFENIKYLYFIGASDGAIPKAATNGGIFTQSDRERLKAADFVLAPTAKEKSFTQKFYLYQVMTKPSNKLLITFPRVNGGGEPVRKSYIIPMVCNLYRGLEITDHLEFPRDRKLETFESAKELLIDYLREYMDNESLASDKEYIKNLTGLIALLKDYKEEEIAALIDAACFYHRDDSIGRAAMKAVSGGSFSGSVSRLEQYASCAYAYFLRYGLRLEERATAEFQALDMGNLYHSALEEYSKLLSKSDSDWFNVSESEMDSLLDKAISSVFSEDDLKTKREEYILKRMKTTLSKTVGVLTKQVRAGYFVPTGFEVDFRSFDNITALQIELSDNEKMNLNGKIDRLDTYEKDKRVYVKIIDYKSGNKKIDFNKLNSGLQIQLITYMSATMEGLKDKYPDKEILPGALLYYNIDDPMVDARDRLNALSFDEYSDMTMKLLRGDGLLNGSVEVVEALDKDLEDSSDSLVVNLGKKKDGTLKKNERVISEEDFRIISDAVRLHMENTAKNMADGDISTNPYRLSNTDTACAFCPYHSVCGFDEEICGYEYREITKLKKDEILDSMRLELDENHGDATDE